MKLKKKVNKKLEDILDITQYNAIRKEVNQNFSLSSLFSPYISKFINYNDRSIFSCSIDKFNRRLKLKSDNAILELMDDLYELGLNPVLAGGKLISYINQESFVDSSNDYDLFFTNEEDLYHFKDYVQVYQSIDSKTGKNIDKKDTRFEILTKLPYVTELVYISKVDIKVKIQLVHKIYSCVEDIIENFDIRCCSVAYFKGQIYWVKGALKDIKNKKLVLLNPRVSEKVFVRIIKYASKGYSIDIPDLMCLSVLCLDSVFDSKPVYFENFFQRNIMVDRAIGYMGGDEDVIAEITPIRLDIIPPPWEGTPWGNTYDIRL